MRKTGGKDGSCRAMGRIESCQERAGINEYAQLFLHSASARYSRAFLLPPDILLCRRVERICVSRGEVCDRSGFLVAGDPVPAAIIFDRWLLK